MKKKEKKIKVVWDDEAKKSLRSVYDHIKDRESVRVARRVRTEILIAIGNNKSVDKDTSVPQHMNTSSGLIIE